MNIAVVGHKDLISGFQLAGIRLAVEVDSSEDLLEQCRKLMKRDDLAIIVAAESLCASIQSDLKELKQRPHSPVLLEVPDKLGQLAKPIPSIHEIIGSLLEGTASLPTLENK